MMPVTCPSWMTGAPESPLRIGAVSSSVGRRAMSRPSPLRTRASIRRRTVAGAATAIPSRRSSTRVPPRVSGGDAAGSSGTLSSARSRTASRRSTVA